jgi:hypothetical protein
MDHNFQPICNMGLTAKKYEVSVSYSRERVFFDKNQRVTPLDFEAKFDIF